MKKIIVILCIIGFIPSLAGQDFESARIRGLKRSLGSLTGVAKADCLISICEEYFNAGFFGENDRRTDSIHKYSLRAQSESEQIRYQRGVDHSAVYGAFVKIIRGNYTDAEKSLKHVLLSRKSSENMLGHANGFLARIVGEYYNKQEEAVAYHKTALGHFTRAGNEIEQSLIYTRLGMTYTKKEDFENAVYYCTRAIILARKLIANKNTNGWENFMYLQPLAIIASLYRLGGDHITAKEYVKESLNYKEKHNLQLDLNYELGQINFAQGKYDSAAYFFKLEAAKSPHLILYPWELGKTYLQAKDYYTAIKYLKQSADTFRNRIAQPNRPRAKQNLVETLILLAKANYGLKKYPEASRLATEGLQLMKEVGHRFTVIDQCELLADAYQFTGTHDSALKYFRRYAELKDSLVSKRFLITLNNAKRLSEDERKAIQLALLEKNNLVKEEQLKQQQLLKEQKDAQLSLLDKDNKLKDELLKQETFLREQKESHIALLDKDNKLKKQQLQQEAFVKNVVLGSLLVFLVIGVFIIRTVSLRRKNERLMREKVENELKLQQLQNEKKQAEFQRQASELEMQALRAQMNPHFIFNCLSSINWLILENNTDAASDYLTRFSKLIRMVLTNSERSLIPLDEELKMLRFYLEMEQLRFENSFDYEIIVGNSVATDSIAIAPLLLQPFCENAIWHGLLHKEGKGKLAIELNEEDNILYCTITDNGVGRQKSSELNGKSAKKHKSMGLKITSDRLALFNQMKDAQTYFEMEDLVDTNGQAAGTRVMIKIKTHHGAMELV